MRIVDVPTALALTIVATGAFAKGQVLDGAPLPMNTAQTWCVAPTGPLPNWDGPAHPECQMAWRVLAERTGRRR